MTRWWTPVVSAAAALVVATTSSGAAVPRGAAPPAVEPREAAGAGHVAGTSCPAFPADDYWHADVSRLPVSRHSRQWLAHMSTGVDLHPDFGPNDGPGPDYGIPVTVVGRHHATVRVHFRYASESDRVRYPLGSDTRIEGGARSDGDRHAIVVQRGTCTLYEVYAAREVDGRWHGGSGAVWSLRSNRLRPDGWTSADAAGLPILPGLLRWSEVRARHVDHAIRFTTDVTTSGLHLWPARHDAGSTSSRAYPPMGARFRLKASWSAAGLSPEARAVVRAMKTYGLVLADNGSPWYFGGEENAHWPDRLIADLKTIPAAAFVAVDTSSLKKSNGSAAVE